MPSLSGQTLLPLQDLLLSLIFLHFQSCFSPVSAIKKSKIANISRLVSQFPMTPYVNPHWLFTELYSATFQLPYAALLLLAALTEACSLTGQGTESLYNMLIATDLNLSQNVTELNVYSEIGNPMMCKLKHPPSQPSGHGCGRNSLCLHNEDCLSHQSSIQTGLSHITNQWKFH